MMEVSSQIKKYRTNMNLSQEELAERVFVTRQTISNWENGKNYPDIHSLLLLSALFDISLDQLIKGDIKPMEEEISKSERQGFHRDSGIFSFLLVLFVISVVPLGMLLHYYGYLVSALIYVAAIYYAARIERHKKKYHIQTYKEIVAFTKGTRLDELEKARESGKRPYQKLFIVVAFGVAAFIICMGFAVLLK